MNWLHRGERYAGDLPEKGEGARFEGAGYKQIWVVADSRNGRHVTFGTREGTDCMAIRIEHHDARRAIDGGIKTTVRTEIEPVWSRQGIGERNDFR